MTLRIDAKEDMPNDPTYIAEKVMDLEAEFDRCLEALDQPKVPDELRLSILRDQLPKIRKDLAFIRSEIVALKL